MGNHGYLHTGDTQWMTAGSGVLHKEGPSVASQQSGGRTHGLQLWVNLPAALKMSPPRYQGLQADALLTIAFEGGEAQLIAGEMLGQRGPVETLVDMTMATLTLTAGARLALPIPAERQIFLYVISGQARVAGTTVRPFDLVELNADGDQLDLAADQDCRLLLGHAVPFGEPIFAHGPFVMTTREEIVQAIDDYQRGRFGPPPRVA
jgi:redox-sensitive bicupin YhaK (pirin superfamily)